MKLGIGRVKIRCLELKTMSSASKLHQRRIERTRRVAKKREAMMNTIPNPVHGKSKPINKQRKEIINEKLVTRA
jgi:hypothetical protein